MLWKLVNVTSKRGRVRPLFRVAGLFGGFLLVIGGPLLMSVDFPQWRMILMGFESLALGVLFIYVGLTGENYDAPSC